MDGLRANALFGRDRPEDTLIGLRIGPDGEAVNFVSAGVPDAYPTAAVEQVGADRRKMAGHLSSGGSRPGLASKRYPCRIENDIVIEIKVEEKTGHTQSHLQKVETESFG